MATDDVYTQKKAFIEAQVRRLTGTLAPSREFKAAAASSSVEDKDRLSETVVDNAVYKLNLAMRKQNRLQYSTQAIRHVSTQITELYRARLDADRETGIQGGESATLLDILSGRADFTDPNVISVIPDVWPAESSTDEQEEYSQQVAELQSLSTAITSLQRKQKYYESLLSLAEETLGDPTVNVQPNIVTKTGPIADELKKMRTLLAKVTDHLTTSNIKLTPDTHQPNDSQEMDLEKWDSLSRLLEQVNQEGIFVEQ